MFNLKPEVFLPLSAIAGCVGVVVQLPHVPTSSLCGVDHLHEPVTLMTQVQPYISLPWLPHDQLEAEERESTCTHSHTVFEALLFYV